MSAAGAEVGRSDGPSDMYEALENYNWDDDVEFQAGLSAILGSNSSPEQAAELALRARCFYYARKFNVIVDFDTYKAYRNARGRPPPQTNGVQPLDFTEVSHDASSEVTLTTESPSIPQYPTSFAHIVELITSGQPIPGIKEIPDTVLTGQGTQPEKPRRRKPWEKDEPAVAAEGGT
ncbi:hypothetical protein N0V94_007020 [Neodidymelliopsis sp. IMI 364377]|nr:hypothetical protein N0V94_007020 [Neodidymelliopsis sp. IMI 364377]